MRALPEIFFFAIVFYILYRFIFNFVVPIARTTRQVKQQFRNMQETHNQQNAYQESVYDRNNSRQEKPTSNGKGGEYIDFEEVK